MRCAQATVICTHQCYIISQDHTMSVRSEISEAAVGSTAALDVPQEPVVSSGMLKCGEWCCPMCQLPCLS